MKAIVNYFGLFSTSKRETYTMRKAISNSKHIPFLQGIGGEWEEKDSPSESDLSDEKMFYNLPILEVEESDVERQEDFYSISSVNSTALIGWEHNKGGAFVVLYTQSGGVIYPSALLKIIPKPLIIREVLEEIKRINELDFSETSDEYWDGSLSYNGVKRLLYGVWNNGRNEEGIRIIADLSKSAKKEYRKIIEKYKNYEKPYIRF